MERVIGSEARSGNLPQWVSVHVFLPRKGWSTEPPLATEVACFISTFDGKASVDAGVIYVRPGERINVQRNGFSISVRKALVEQHGFNSLSRVRTDRFDVEERR